MKTWRDYSASSLRDFLKNYTDGDIDHGGRRFECAVCGSEFSDPFAVRTCWQYYHGDGDRAFSDEGYDPSEHCIEILFDENGEKIDE
jgi:hypothetical protein